MKYLLLIALVVAGCGPKPISTVEWRERQRYQADIDYPAQDESVATEFAQAEVLAHLTYPDDAEFVGPVVVRAMVRTLPDDDDIEGRKETLVYAVGQVKAANSYGMRSVEPFAVVFIKGGDHLPAARAKEAVVDSSRVDVFIGPRATLWM